MSTLNIPYTFMVVSADERGMVLRFEAPGQPPLDWGCRLPFSTETVADVAREYDPRPAWADMQRTRVVPEVGASGVIQAAPPPPEQPLVPQVVTRFQARAALHIAGLLEPVEALMAHPDTPVIAKLAWADAQEFKRASPTIAQMAAALGLTDAQLDSLFITAAGIDA